MCVPPRSCSSSRNDLDIDILSTARRLGGPGYQTLNSGSSMASSLRYVTDRDAVHEAIDDLLRPQGVEDNPVLSGFRTVVFTDIVGSTEFVRRAGDDEGRAAIRDLEAQVAELAAEHGGRVVKNLGDGSLISFGSNTSAPPSPSTSRPESTMAPSNFGSAWPLGNPPRKTATSTESSWSISSVESRRRMADRHCAGGSSRRCFFGGCADDGFRLYGRARIEAGGYRSRGSVAGS